MKKLKLPILIIFCIFVINKGFGQPSRFSFEKYINDKGDTLNYRLLNPDSNPLRKYPLVIFLHGSGERGNDNDAQLKWGVSVFATDEMMKKYPAIVVAPQCPKDLSWANISRQENRVMNLLPEASKPMKLTIELIHKLIRTLPVDSSRIYITGLSMGGFGTFDAIERYPDLFAAAVPVCGGGDVSRAPSIAHIPMWIFHGANDPTVNPLYSRDMVEALFKAGAHPGFTMYPGVGHYSWLGAYNDNYMIEWLFQQRKR